MDCSKSVYESRKWLYARVLRISILLLWLICVCSCVFASEDVEYLTIDNLAIRPSSNSIVEYQGAVLYYIELEPGYQYTITNISNSSNAFGFFNSFDINSPVSVSILNKNSSYSFNGSSGFLYIGNSSTGASYFTITREPLLGQKGAIDNIIYYVLYELWPTFGQLATVISFTIVFALGYYLLKYYLQRISKGKE